MMERNLTTEAIVLTSRRWGELHRLVTLLSPTLGVFDAVAYGARKGKLAGGIEPFAIGTYFLYHDRVRKEYSIKDIELENQDPSIKENLTRLYAGHAMAEMAMRMHGGDHEELYGVLTSHIKLLGSESTEPRRLCIQFIWRLIDIMGLAPDLEACPLCGRQYNDREILSFHTGLHSPCCSSCADIDREGFELALGPGARRYLSLTRPLDPGIAVSVELSEAATQRLFSYMVRYVTNILGSPLRSLIGGVLLETMT